jgi:hypothetical protein
MGHASEPQSFLNNALWGVYRVYRVYRVYMRS